MKNSKDPSQKKSIPPVEAKPDILLITGILFLTFLAFLPSLSNGIIFLDDPEYIVNNPYTKTFNLKEIFSAYYMGNYHPLTLLSYSIEYKLFGMNIFMFHLDNLLLHLFNTFLVFIIIFKLFNTNYFFMAPITAIFFGIHPMHVESVAWLSERKDVLHAFFYLLAILSYLNYLNKDKKIGWLVITFIFTMLSLLSKGQAVSLPFIFLLIDFLNNKSEKFIIYKNDLLNKIPFFILTAIFGYLAIEAQKSAGAIANNTNIFYSFYTVFIYVFKFLIPINLSGFHSYPQSVPPFIYLGVLIIPVIIYLIVKTYKKHKVFFFGMMFFLISIAPMLKFVPVGDTIIAERYTYLPYIGLFIILGYWFENFSNRFKNYSRIFQGAMVIIILLFSSITFSYTKVYKNNRSYWENVIKHYPDNWRANHCLGKSYYDSQEYDKAIVYFSRAIDRDKNCAPFPYLWRGITYLEKLNNPNAAISDFKIVAELNDTANELYKEAMLNIGLAYYKKGEIDAAISQYSAIIINNPSSPRAYNLRALAFASKKDYVNARMDALQARKLGIEISDETLNSWR